MDVRLRMDVNYEYEFTFAPSCVLDVSDKISSDCYCTRMRITTVFGAISDMMCLENANIMPT